MGSSCSEVMPMKDVICAQKKLLTIPLNDEFIETLRPYGSLMTDINGVQQWSNASA